MENFKKKSTFFLLLRISNENYMKFCCEMKLQTPMVYWVCAGPKFKIDYN